MIYLQSFFTTLTPILWSAGEFDIINLLSKVGVAELVDAQS